MDIIGADNRRYVNLPLPPPAKGLRRFRAALAIYHHLPGMARFVLFEHPPKSAEAAGAETIDHPLGYGFLTCPPLLRSLVLVLGHVLMFDLVAAGP